VTPDISLIKGRPVAKYRIDTIDTTAEGDMVFLQSDIVAVGEIDIRGSLLIPEVDDTIEPVISVVVSDEFPLGQAKGISQVTEV
jgi:hypothetical protein